MNANELADIVDKWAYKESAEYLTDAANMLRQQQAEIQALKQVIDANNLSQNIGQFVKPANEPVAWINLDRFNDEALYLADCVSETKVDNMGITTPLYTHPVQKPMMVLDGNRVYPAVKELTDAEIKSEAKYLCHSWHSQNPERLVLFARAILRKAQEK